MTMEDHMQRIKLMPISRSRQKSPSALIDSSETTQYRALASTFLYVDNVFLLQACLVASKMQQRLSCLKVEHLLDGSATVRVLKSMNAKICFPSLNNIRTVVIVKYQTAHKLNAKRYMVNLA